MPHISLEYSENVMETENVMALLEQISTLLSLELPTKLEFCKSRALESRIFSIGLNHKNAAFVHLGVKVMPGRTKDTLDSISQKVLEVLKAYFSDSLKDLKLQISVEITELSPSYLKYTA